MLHIILHIKGSSGIEDTLPEDRGGNSGIHNRFEETLEVIPCLFYHCSDLFTT